MVNVAERKMADAVGKVLVTGGAGFIGSHLVDSLMDRGCSVRVLDDLSNGSLKNLERWLSNPGFEFVQGDLKSLDVAKRGVEDVETVFHLAANPDVRLGESDPSVHFNENLLVTFNLLEAMRKSETDQVSVVACICTACGQRGDVPT